MKTRPTLRRRTIASLLTFVLLLTTTSCGIMDSGNDSRAGSGSGGHAGGGANSDSQVVSRPPKPTGSISTGDRASLTSGTVAPSGSTIAVQKQGDPLDGLQIVVPPGSYPDSRQFEVSAAPVNSHTFGEYFTPATPVISIENGGDYSDEFMTVTIPVEVPPDHFAMAFYYDDTAGTLEGIPFNAMDENSITIVTRHFSNIIVSIIKSSVLDDLMKSDIDSHFRPGIDDWQFTNYGSYIARGGHCAGQCLTELWYFCEQPDGQDLTLNGRYDNNGNRPFTPDLWEDDSHGYRLASTVQKDINWSSFENELMANLAGKDDDLTLKAFAYSIQLTGEPQEVGIFASAGGGHDMICYRVHNDSLYIADPNYPGNTERRIQFVNGHFKPYESGANAAEIAAGDSTTYETIEYCAKSATVNWKTIAARWNEFKDGTIGDDSFPEYQIVIVDHEGNEAAFTDGYKSKEQKISIQVKSDVPVGTRVYRNGARITQDSNGRYELAEGNNLIGIDIWGDVNSNPQNRDYRYIDFQYFNVQYGASECHGWVLDSIEEKELTVRPGNDYERNISFTATVDGAYRGSGQMVLPTIDGDVLADYSASGSWTYPDCIRPGETAEFTVSCTSSLTLSSPVEWCCIYNDMSVAGPWESPVIINQAVDSANPTMHDSVTTEWPCPWEGGPGQSFDVSVRCATDAGWASYVYTYVWQD